MTFRFASILLLLSLLLFVSTCTHIKVNEFAHATQNHSLVNVNDKKHLYFIHIGKCGGSSVKSFLNKHDISYQAVHLHKPTESNLDSHQYILVNVRNPLTRYASAYNYVRNIVTQDVTQFKHGVEITFNNSLAPHHTKHKVDFGFVYSHKYDDMVVAFKDANDLAESITSSDIKRKKIANDLMRDQTEHIFKGMGYYLNNGAVVDKYHEKMNVVRTENMNEDLRRFAGLFDIHVESTPKRVRANSHAPHGNLTDLARQNIYNFYRNSDYLALDALIRYNLIEDLPDYRIPEGF